jgi:hypothetical protein
VGTKLDTALAALSAKLRGCGRANRQLAAKTRKSLHHRVPEQALVRNPRSLIGARHRWSLQGVGREPRLPRRAVKQKVRTGCAGSGNKPGRDPQMIGPASLT